MSLRVPRQKHPRWHFVVQPGRNAAEKAYCLSPRIHPTAAMVVILGMNNPQLRIQGKAG